MTNRMFRRAQILLSACVALVVPRSLDAQVLRLTLRDAVDRTPVIGALVSVRDSVTGRQIDVVSGSTGDLSLRLPFAGSWSVLVRQIGLIPRRVAPMRIVDGATQVVELLLERKAFQLATQRVVRDSTYCMERPNGQDRTAAIWAQVSLALESSIATRNDTTRADSLYAEVFESDVDLKGRTLAARMLSRSRGQLRPFSALSPAQLDSIGYAREDRNGDREYFAPDERVLLSDLFVETHCFTVPPSDSLPEFAELVFRPVPGRSRIDISGKAYVDVESGELKRIVYRYVPDGRIVPNDAKRAGGEVSLQRLDGGVWIVSEWTLRMPLFSRRSNFRLIAPVLVGYRELRGTTTFRNAQFVPAPVATPP
jgi:hypothetical protein